MSKGSKRRKEDTSKIVDNWDNIDWGKPKKKEVKPMEAKPVKVKESHPTECICKECMDTLANEIMSRKQVITDESE